MSNSDYSDPDDIQKLEIEFLLSIFENNQNHCLLEYDKLSRRGSFTFHPQFYKPIELYGPSINIKLRNSIPVEPLPNTIDKYCYLLQYLPVFIMTFILPSEYPGHIPNVSIPKFSLSSIWMPLSLLTELEIKLAEIANNNLGEMTLLSCIEYLQNEYFYYMIEKFHGRNLQSVSFDLFKFYEYYKVELTLSIQDICHLLLSNNDDRLDVEFDESLMECAVCFETKKGKLFIRFAKCKCFICRDCTIGSFKLSVNESLFNGPLTCLQCGEEVNYTEIRYILPEDIFNKYESLVLKRGLDIMPDIVYCPRPQCEFPVILDSENLGRCPKCELSFCPMCLKTYHGVNPCKIKLQTFGTISQEDNELILQRLKEEEESEKLISEKYKLCPGCWTPCEKITGCNKMTCSYCHLFFCWLCLYAIHDRHNPYSHFSNGTCQGQLWTDNTIEFR
ncbi:putative ring finger protein 14 (androgen receptor-associated protein 54) (triad2 protein) [Schistosoma mansoni]|uniref:RBR-type E3 ubiquitin transferase n=1 Tax=Schistosoma mansoni TaxID=6183 RepID=G4VHM9_SCHMA|nr:putative ring finger protein 14 (androgen receptor-associated protein 54) (triad2 protein) [Schistosoma mansoni]|eukprot:XP_018652495.1 putative ring finger protein 14 (androgen receptor-associated protein 54) (triad2 protein) [Schistosoma mansoni]